MAFQYQLLRAKIIEKYGSQGKFADVIGLSEVSISRKLNESVGFSKDDILKWCELLEIKQEDIGRYFFA